MPTFRLTVAVATTVKLIGSWLLAGEGNESEQHIRFELNASGATYIVVVHSILDNMWPTAQLTWDNTGLVAMKPVSNVSIQILTVLPLIAAGWSPDNFSDRAFRLIPLVVSVTIISPRDHSGLFWAILIGTVETSSMSLFLFRIQKFEGILRLYMYPSRHTVQTYPWKPFQCHGAVSRQMFGCCAQALRNSLSYLSSTSSGQRSQEHPIINFISFICTDTT